MIHLKNLLNIGVSDSLDLVESNKQRVFNLFILLALPAIPFVLLFNFIKGNYGMVLMNSLQMFIFLFAFWISYRKKFLFLRTYLLILLSFIIFFAAIYYKTGIEYRLLLLLVVGVILFDNNIKFLLFALLIATEFTICKFFELNSPEVQRSFLIIRVLQIFIPFVITGISLYYLKYIYLKSQLKLQNTLHELSQSHEMRENLMYSLAHDLRSPLSNVSSLVNLLKTHETCSADGLKWIEMIEFSTNNSNALVTELLESNELMKQQVDPQLIDLNILLDSIIVAARLKANAKNIEIQFQKKQETCFAKVDPIKFDRLISNLINNAIKFSYENGNIFVSAASTSSEFIISVKDEGVGIAEKHITTIFDPFTKAKRKGTNNEVSFGLGLSFCKQIVALHKGKIQVISELGKGTEFIVSIPASQ